MTKSNLPDFYSQKDLDKAKTKGQVIGWIQGGLIGVGGMLLLNLVGWIPLIAITVIGSFVAYKVFAGSSKAS